MSTENNINLSSLNASEFGIVRQAMGDWNDYGNESGFFTGNAMKNSPCKMESDKDYWYVTNICMSIDSFATQTAVNAFTKETFIRNRENGVWKEWSRLGNGCDSDTVDGKHANDFIINYGIVDDVNKYCQQANPCVIKWNSNTLNTPFKIGLTGAVTGVIYVNTVNTGWTTMIAIPDGGNNVFIKSFKGINVVKEWESLRNADTLDGKHANDFMLKSATDITSRNEILSPGIYKMYQEVVDSPLNGHAFNIFAMQEGWGIVIIAISVFDTSVIYTSTRRTNNSGKTFYWTDWDNLKNAKMLEGKTASDFGTSKDVTELKNKIKALKEFIQTW